MRKAFLFMVLALVFPAIASGHEITKREARRAAKAELEDEVRWWKREGEIVLSYRLRRCEYHSDHVVVCGYRIEFDTGPCVGEYTVRFTSSKKRRIGVFSTPLSGQGSYFDCDEDGAPLQVGGGGGRGGLQLKAYVL